MEAKRQIEILGRLLDRDTPIEFREFYDIVEKHYLSLTEPFKAYIRDLNQLGRQRAIWIRPGEKDEGNREYLISVRPEWATEITETSFYKQINQMPKAKTKLLVSP